MNYTTITPDSPELQSLSPIHGNLAALQQLFPSVVREGKMDFDALRQLLGDDIAKDDELYGLQWHGKARARRNALTPSLGTLRPCKAESKNWDSTRNLYIEGDNLEVLKLLQKSYAGKVKMIYIDPPYNTGKEFVYPDNYQNGIEHYLKLTGQTDSFKANAETGGRYHTDWLNMMYPRLMLARELLSDDGVIFISIDDHEVGNVREICDEIFGDVNRIGLMTLLSNPRGSQNSKHLSFVHEYIFMYSKNLCSLDIKGIAKAETSLAEFKEIDDNGRKYRFLGLRKRGGAWRKEDRPNMFYPIYVNPVNGKCSLTSSIEYPIEVIPKRPTGELSRWTWSKEKFISACDTVLGRKVNRIDSSESWDIFRKDYIDNDDGVEKTTKIKTIWDEKETNYQNAKNEIKKLFGNSEIFDYPKPTHIVKKLASMLYCEDGDIILDFFSGSSSAAHASMQLNAEDGGNRRFIMVQLPEACVEGSEAAKAGYKNICEIGKERIRRAGEKVKEEAGEKAEGLDIGFRVFKLDSSNVKPWDTEAGMLNMQLEQESNLRPERSSEDIFYEVLLKQGIELTEDCHTREVAGHTVYSLGYGQYYCCFDERIGDEAQELAAGIALWHAEEDPDGQSCVVYVRDTAFDSGDIMQGTQGDESDARKKSFCLTLEQSNIMQVKAI